MLLKLFRYLLGYVVVEGESVSCEDFLVSCTKAGIKLWAFKKNGVSMSFKIRCKHYKLLRRHCKKTNTKVHVAKKVGAYFVVRKYKKRWGLLLGAVIVLLIAGYLSGSVLTIRVQGNFAVESHEVISAAKQHGLDIFVRKSDVDFAVIENILPGELPLVSWVGISVMGTNVTINVSEIEKQSEPEKDTQPTDVISTAEGQIIRIIPTNGQAVVNVGDGVIKGQLLISGVLTDTAGNVTLTHACGEVYALTTCELSYEFKSEVVVREYTASPYTRYYISYGEYKIPLYFGEDGAELYEFTTLPHEFNMFGFSLPFTLVEETVSEYTESKVVLDDTTALEYGKDMLKTIELTELFGVKIHSREISIKKTSEGYKVTGIYSCEQEISKLRDIVVLP